MEAEKALVLANQCSVMWRQEKANKFTRGHVVSEDLSQNVVAVCGVVLPRVAPRQVEQVCMPSQQVNAVNKEKNIYSESSILSSGEPEGSRAGGFDLSQCAETGTSCSVPEARPSRGAYRVR